MNYEYFEQNLGTGPFGMYRTYWIVDYRFVNITGEPKRHLKPTEVRAFDISENSPNIHVPHAKYYFREVLNDGILSDEIIQPYDSHGTFATETVGVNVLMSREMAFEVYYLECLLIKSQIDDAKGIYAQKFDELEESLERDMKMAQDAVYSHSNRTVRGFAWNSRNSS